VLPNPTTISGIAEYTRYDLIQGNEILRPAHDDPPAPVPPVMIPNGLGAKELGCQILYSEDLNAGQDHAGVEVRNPFLT
jgi:hypothetical protein